MASNYDNIVFVEEDDRRWFCLEVDSKYSGPQTEESQVYFNKLRGVDVRHFAYLLYNRDIAGFNPRRTPSSDYHRYQRKINLDSLSDWVEHSLQNGVFALSKPQPYGDEPPDMDWISLWW